MLSLNNSNCWKLLRANTTTTWGVSPSVNVKNVMDWTISSQVTSGEVKGSTTRKSNLEQVKFPRTGCTCQMQNKGDIVSLMVARKLFVEKKELESKYLELKSASKTALFYGVSKKLILTYLKKYDIKARTNIIKKPSRKILNELVTNGFTTKEIAVRLNVSTTSVLSWLRGYDLPFNDFFHKGYSISHNGYKLVKKEVGKYQREHRKIVENSLKRKLTNEEIVHHINGDKFDNRLENLQIMSKSEHCKLHLPRLGTGKDIVSS